MPVAIYVLSVVERRQYARTSESQFFLAKDSLNQFEFSNSSIAYGFQIASISIFVAWGYTFGLGALVNPIFWGLGILLFSVAIRRVTESLRDNETLHGYLARSYGSQPLGVIGASMTVIGYLGALTAELSIGSTVLSVIIPNKYAIAFVVSALALGIATYVWLVGQHAALQTDQLQLGFFYLGFISLALAFSWLAIDKNGNVPGVTIATLMLFVLLVGTVAGVKAQTGGLTQALMGSDYVGHAGKRMNTVLIILVVYVGLCVSALNLIKLLTVTASTDVSKVAIPLFDLSQGFLNLLSLAMLPLFWQFIDVPMWQRLGALRPRSADNTESRARDLRKGLLRFAFESPATWILAILVGMCLRQIDVGVTSESIWTIVGAFPNLLVQSQALGILGVALGVAFLMAVVATMLSTADSMLMGTVFVVSRDFFGPTHGQDTSESEAVRRDVSIARVASYAIIGVAIAIIWLQVIFELDIVSILMGAYSAQLSLVPCVLGAVLGPKLRLGATLAISSVLAGFTLSAVAAAVALNNPTWQLYPPLFALGGAFSVYLIGGFFRTKEHGPLPLSPS